MAWDLPLESHDVSQADIAPFMSTLLGRPVPVNSVGVLPANYLSGGEERKARTMVVNAKTILEQYRVKHAIKKEHILRYQPFSDLSHDEGSSPGSAELQELKILLSKGEWKQAQEKSTRLIAKVLEGLRYLQTYDRTLLGFIVTLGYIGWSLYSGLFVIQRFGSTASKPSVSEQLNAFPLVSFLSIFSIAAALLAMRHSPLTYYAYVAFPIWFWISATKSLWKLKTVDLGNPFSWLAGGIAVIASLLAMVAGYTHRSIWSIGFLVIGLFWPIMTALGPTYRKQDIGLWTAWTVSCLCTAIFPVLSVQKTEDIRAMSPHYVYNSMLGGAAMIATGLVGTMIQGGIVLQRFTIQVILIILSMIVTASSIQSLQAKQGLPLQNQIAGWLCFLIAPCVPFISQRSTAPPLLRLLDLFLALGPCFIILSISVEGLFYVAFSISLALWVEVESRVNDSTVRQTKKTGVSSSRLSRDSIRIALFFLFFVQVAFFGTGNVASMSSFYLEPVYRLVPIFNPFLMASLLTFKIVAPYVILSAAFAALTAHLGLPPFSLFLIAMSVTDGMTLAFFYNVTDTGRILDFVTRCEVIRNHIKTSNLPGPASASFLFGDSKRTSNVDDGAALFLQWQKEYEIVHRIHGPLNTRRIVLLDLKAYNIPPSGIKMLSMFVGDNSILALSRHAHKNMGKVLNTVFIAAAIKTYLPAFIEASYKPQTRWDNILQSLGTDGMLINVVESIEDFSLDVISSSVFTHDLGALEGRKSLIADTLRDLGNFQVTSQRFHSILLLLSTRNGLISKFSESMDKIVEAVLSRIHTEDTLEKSAMVIFLKTYGAALSPKDLKVQMKSLLFAGNETTAVSLKDKQKLLREELQKPSGNPAFNDFTKDIPYLDAVLREVLRLHAPATITRETYGILPLENTVKLKNGSSTDRIFVGRGSTLIIPIPALNTSARF
ncbi:hypothetical protein M422DRAFT_264143 [Sphaerobolus stellatus SS14]|uniref:GPI ethanolamine phosphate transferase 1 n=1 Tax=Sphaerobolus stellatus (strain SS14) TaxID=990650 RepID=A0A0C9UX36_SPHS4|nr:hypothetical protein M422DRAFT_264143 [Sphaerobolus stellatus SS14]